MTLVDTHRAAASWARRQAAESRDLSAEIAGREAILRERLPPAVSRHTDEVWSSQAADRSRRRLVAVASSTVTFVRDDLARVRLALDQRAQDLDATARAELRQAELLEVIAVPGLIS